MFQASLGLFHVLENDSRTGESRTRYSSIRSACRICLKRDFLWWKKQPRRAEEGFTSATALWIWDSEFVVKKDGLRLLGSPAVYLHLRSLVLSMPANQRDGVRDHIIMCMDHSSMGTFSLKNFNGLG